VVEGLVATGELVSAFERLRSHWKLLYEGAPESSDERAEMLKDIEKDLGVISSAARLSVEAIPFVGVSFRIRLDEWQPEGVTLPADLTEAAEGVRSGLEMRLRTLRQMESGDDILPDSGRDVRRSAARDACFFHKLRKLSMPGNNAENNKGAEPVQIDLARLSQCFDGRRKLVREEIAVPAPALEAIEFLVRLGASG
jgi:hypothetical protein